MLVDVVASNDAMLGPGVERGPNGDRRLDRASQQSYIMLDHGGRRNSQAVGVFIHLDKYK